MYHMKHAYEAGPQCKGLPFMLGVRWCFVSTRTIDPALRCTAPPGHCSYHFIRLLFSRAYSCGISDLVSTCPALPDPDLLFWSRPFVPGARR